MKKIDQVRGVNSSGGGGASAKVEREFTTYEADVAVVGGGVGGLLAARNAMLHGKTVILLDKGPFGHSGASGINWGHLLGSYEDVENPEDVMINGPIYSQGLVDQEYYMGVIKGSKDLKLYELATKIGCVLERSNEDGTALNAPPQGLFPRMLAQYVRRLGVHVLERTMVLDILQAEDGSAAGVVAIDLVDGRGIVVRSKAVVLATGPAVWCNGWTGSSAKTNAGPESTGDGIAILMKHGVPVSGLEFEQLYFYNANPEPVAFSQGIGFAHRDHPENLMNKNGERFFEKSAAWKDSPTQATFYKVTMKEIYEGRGTEKGGILADISRLEEPQYYLRFSRRGRENLKRGLGYDIGDTAELVPTPWECCTIPKLSERMETIIPGLFNTSATYGYVIAATGTGHRAGESAAEHASKVDYKKINYDVVQEVLEAAYGALEREGTGKRALEVQHEIQNVMYTYLFSGRTEEGIKTAIAELERIKREDIPNMIVPDKSRRFNCEWRQAMEVPFMWIYTMAKAHAALTRTETRGLHHRLDYPNMDNTNWLKSVYVKLENGEFTATAEDIVDTYISADEIRKMIPEIGIGDYPQTK